MRLGLQLSLAGPNFAIDMDLVREAETLGFDSVWTGEAHGSDSVTPIAWVLAVESGELGVDGRMLGGESVG